LLSFVCNFLGLRPQYYKRLTSAVIGYLVMMVMTAYLTRGLQMAVGSSKRAATARAEELGDETDEIPIARASVSASEPPSAPISESPSSVALSDLSAPPRSQLALSRPHPLRSGQGSSDERIIQALEGRPTYNQAPPPPHRAQRWSAFFVNRLDWMTYAIIYITIGLPIYYAVGYAMPAQLCLGIMAYFAAMEIPPAWIQYLHPVLVSSLMTVLGTWAMASIKGDDLHTTLKEYQTGVKYLQLWERSSRGILPGAGDVFGTILDASIVALALPMYQYRRELREHFIAIIVPNVLISIASLFTYPALCFAIGISANRSLAFAARSLTLALATPATRNLGGDVNTVAAVAIMSGILGVLIGQRMLALMRIPEGGWL
jgi:putative effector of murein hydrolase